MKAGWKFTAKKFAGKSTMSSPYRGNGPPIRGLEWPKKKKSITTKPKKKQSLAVRNTSLYKRSNHDE